jgi:2-oxoglutarate ferredoxin oxidoreductase subunit beta
VRYNMKMTVMLLDNQIYGLTKMQSSPTTPKGKSSLTHPQGTTLSPLNPLTVTLGITNASFVAQSVDWNPPHLYATLRAAHHHPGLAFVRVLQRCPHYMPNVWDALREDPSGVMLLTHENGIRLDAATTALFRNRREHDPADLDTARELASRSDVLVIGLLYHNPAAERYDEVALRGFDMPRAARLEAAQREVDRFLI